MENQPEPILVEFIRYNNWANQQVLQACQNLSDEQLDSAVPGVYGTIRDTLLHMIWAEADYVGRLTGARPYPALFKRGDKPTVAGLSAFASDVAPALLDAVQRIPPNHIVHEEEDGNTFDYQARGLFIQVVNHGIEHRTNITTILSSLGLPAPEVDGWGYMEAHPGQFEVKSGSK
jgi:uncharacterized damage-inducible protein DinB